MIAPPRTRKSMRDAETPSSALNPGVGFAVAGRRRRLLFRSFSAPPPVVFFRISLFNKQQEIFFTE
jgi:hypothetical protein